MPREAPQNPSSRSPATQARARGGRGTGSRLGDLTRDWGTSAAISLYLERCQVATPERLVEAAWRHVTDARSVIGKVVDFGAGDGRFSRFGRYEHYLGYKIDDAAFEHAVVPKRARLLNQCAFWDEINDADVCVGNPPFVRNQDLPRGWRERASSVLRRRTGVSLSGLANAWQYFFLLGLASTKSDGLCDPPRLS